ncbi:hypothetical protein BSKO_05112 [Bryopsis sp. KO-2023]|nr:hypothetical protein BSKO_05112 [Bryopsis sp. KO-2023]
MEGTNQNLEKNDLPLRRRSSSQDLSDRFGSVAPLRSIRSAKRRSLRNRAPKPPPGLTRGMVRDMVGFWEEKVEEIKGKPCGCGRDQCPVASVNCEARTRWRTAVERITSDLGVYEREQASMRHRRAISAFSDLSIDETGSVSGLSGRERSICGNDSEVSGEPPYGVGLLECLQGDETPSSMNSINIGGLVSGSDVDAIEASIQSPMSVIETED